MVDGGPDFNPNFSINSLYYGSFFFEQNLDALVVTQYCPGYSAFNPVEHLWAPCTQTLTSVYLPNVLPGESIPPCRQTGIDATTRLNKEHVVFNAAMAKVKDTYWKDLQFAGHRVTIEVEPKWPKNLIHMELITTQQQSSWLNQLQESGEITLRYCRRCAGMRGILIEELEHWFLQDVQLLRANIVQ